MQKLSISDASGLAQKIIEAYGAKKQKIVTAESCTGGMIAASLTDVPGSSAVFERGFITYSNEAKVELLGVLPDTISVYGAVSAETAEAMAQGALEYSHADVAISVTGIAGPTGALPDKPVGLVYIGVATRTGANFHCRFEFTGDRSEIRSEARKEALNLLHSMADQSQGRS